MDADSISKFTAACSQLHQSKLAGQINLQRHDVSHKFESIEFHVALVKRERNTASLVLSKHQGENSAVTAVQLLWNVIW